MNKLTIAQEIYQQFNDENDAGAYREGAVETAEDLAVEKDFLNTFINESHATEEVTYIFKDQSRLVFAGTFFQVRD